MTENSSDTTTPFDVERQRRVEQIINRCFEHCSSGKPLNERQIIEANQELMPELSERLQVMRMIFEQGQFGFDSLLDSLCQMDLTESGGKSVPTPTRAPPIPGSRASLIAELSRFFPDYELVRISGAGAYGCVCVAKDRAGIYRAMKIIQPDRLAHLGIPHREMVALKRYCGKLPDHPNLIKIFHIGQKHHTLYYTMELADDLITKKQIRERLPQRYAPMTLLAVLDKGRLKVDTAVEISLRLLKGLECLHRAGLVHRDIKPANVVFVNREVKLADITLVAFARTNMSLVGTPQYMPPDEQMDATADTFAIGKILHEMISGRDLSGFPELPRDDRIRSNILDTGRIEAVLCKACASSGRDRFGSALEMRVALQACRIPSLESPLIELADCHIRRSLDDSAMDLISPHRAVAGTEPEAAPFGRAESHAPQIISGPTTGEPRLVWAIVDRVIKVVPWLVILILGYQLIQRWGR